MMLDLDFNFILCGAWVDSDYAKNNNIKIGDFIQVKYESLDLNEKVIGLINTPDHIRNVYWSKYICGFRIITYSCFSNYSFKMVADRDYDFGAIITVNTYIISFVVTVVCSYLVSIFIARKIKKIDMVTSLKGNE